MLTSFFSVSKPINFAIIVIAVILYFSSFYALSDFNELTAYSILNQFFILLVYLFSLGVLNFVVKRNTLTRRNTYIVYLFVCFSFAVPATFFNTDIILSGVFVLLALRRIISLKSSNDFNKKIFDAAFWITIASLFFFWSFLFLIVLYFAILFYGRLDYRNWLIPFTGIFAVLIIAITYSLYSDGALAFALNYVQLPTLDFTAYSSIKLLLPASFLLALYLWCGIYYVSQISDAPQKLKASYFLILISSGIALIIILFLAPLRDGSELYFIFGPLAIISATYIENHKSFWFKEMLLWLALLIPIFLLFWHS
ncbi:DUF6427 family protein [Leeuwenhoekiella sp. NPDC079379]|uniref:DUF6427 family protein n=1 Tax=Leeuwenhoekiella sp. NPDC079379 TaxID=3364122 RepID=UPI0037CAF2C5